jgi:hypothetical protein
MGTMALGIVIIKEATFDCFMFATVINNKTYFHFNLSLLVIFG